MIFFYQTFIRRSKSIFHVLCDLRGMSTARAYGGVISLVYHPNLSFSIRSGDFKAFNSCLKRYELLEYGLRIWFKKIMDGHFIDGTYNGFRISYGLPSRGQRTQTMLTLVCV